MTMSIDRRLVFAEELIAAVRDRRLAKLEGLKGHRNDRLRQEAYRWAREKGYIHFRTFREIAQRHPRFKPLHEEPLRTRSVLIVHGYIVIPDGFVWLRKKDDR